MKPSPSHARVPLLMTAAAALALSPAALHARRAQEPASSPAVPAPASTPETPVPAPAPVPAPETPATPSPAPEVPVTPSPAPEVPSTPAPEPPPAPVPAPEPAPSPTPETTPAPTPPAETPPTAQVPAAPAVSTTPEPAAESTPEAAAEPAAAAPHASGDAEADIQISPAVSAAPSSSTAIPGAPAGNAPAPAQTASPQLQAAPSGPASSANLNSPSSAAPSVGGVLPDEDILDIRGPIHIEAPFPWIPWTAGALGTLALGFILWKFVRRPRRKQPAWRTALEKLQACRPLMDGGNAQPFSLAVSEIVRAYIEQSLSLRAAHRTTNEFLHDLVKHSDSPLTAHRAMLAEFLEYCDLAKFARWSLTLPQMEAMLKSAGEFISTIGQAAHVKPQLPPALPSAASIPATASIKSVPSTPKAPA